MTATRPTTGTRSDEAWPTQPPLPAFYLARALGRRRRDRAVAAWSNPGTLHAIPSGEHWDTVRVPADTGQAVLASLQAENRPEFLGPVLLDTRCAATFWLVTRGTPPEHWTTVGHGVALLPYSHPVDMPDPSPDRLAPPAGQPEPVRWLHWPAATGTLTPAVWLAAAITASAPSTPAA